MESETPFESSMTLQPAYSSVRRRIGAFLIDGFIVGILSIIAGNLLPIVGAILVWFFYAPILESSEIRATIGKHLMGIQVTDLLGRRISLRASLMRNILKIVSAAILFIGFFFAFFTEKKQALHDMLADTLVVYGRSDVPIVDAWMEATKDVFRAGKSVLSSQPPDQGAIDVRLERLYTLFKQGGLSQTEYEAAKRKILES